jgi:hypothetical protein
MVMKGQQVPNSLDRPLVQWVLWKWSWSPHKRWGKWHVDTLKGHASNPKSLSPRISWRFVKRSIELKEASWCWKINEISKGNNRVSRRVSVQNIERGSSKQLGHPLTSKVLLHGKHVHFTHFARNKKKKK